MQPCKGVTIIAIILSNHTAAPPATEQSVALQKK